MEEAAGRVPDSSIAVALQALLASRPAPAPDKKPAELEAETLRLIAGFYAATATAQTSDFDLARAVFRLVTDAKEPDRDTMVFLDRVLRTRQPRPLYAETAALRRLADLPPSAWRPGTVRVALDVTRRGELAASRPASLAWVRPLLDAANTTRHEGETIPPRGKASERSRRPTTCSDVPIPPSPRSSRPARPSIEAADWSLKLLALLPASLPYLDFATELDGPWFEVARRAGATVAALAASPTDPSGTGEQVVAIEQQAEALRPRSSPCDARSPLTGWPASQPSPTQPLPRTIARFPPCSTPRSPRPPSGLPPLGIPGVGRPQAPRCGAPARRPGRPESPLPAPDASRGGQRARGPRRSARFRAADPGGRRAAWRSPAFVPMSSTRLRRAPIDWRWSGTTFQTDSTTRPTWRHPTWSAA